LWLESWKVDWKLENGLKVGKRIDERGIREENCIYWNERGIREENCIYWSFYLIFFLLTQVHPGQPIWPVIRSLDRVDYWVGFQNYALASHLWVGAVLCMSCILEYRESLVCLKVIFK
jgi:hypothetical protein